MSDHDELLRLYHMRDYALKIGRFVANKTLADLENDELLEDGLRYAIGIIGEAASQVPAEVRILYPQIPWTKIVGMRNFLFHAYEMIDTERLWQTATDNVPQLLKALENILPSEE